MIIRCTAPKKHNRLQPCWQWLAAVPDGSVVLRTIRSPREAAPENLVLGCQECHTLYEVTPPLRSAA